MSVERDVFAAEAVRLLVKLGKFVATAVSLFSLILDWELALKHWLTGTYVLYL